MTRRKLVITAALLIAGSCGGDGTTTPVPRATATLVIVSGDRQIGSAGSALANSIVMETRSAEGRPVPGTIVAFAVTGGNGSVRDGLDTADASGRVSASWTVGTRAGEAQELTATVVSVTNAKVSPVIATASVIAADPASLDVNPPVLTARVGDALPPISVSVRDRFGNPAPVAGLSITAHLGESAASIVTPPSARTDASGAILSGVTITGRAGTASLIVQSPGLISAHVALTLTAGKPQRLDVVSNATISAVAGTAGPALTVRVSDSWDNLVAGVVVVFAIDGVGPIGQATTTPDGLATLSSWIAPAIGTYRITATSVGVVTTAQILLATLRGPPSVLTPLSSNPTSGVVGTTVVLAVRASDATGTIVPDTPLSWTSGAASGEAFTDELGVAHLNVRLGTTAGPAQVVVKAGSTASVTLGIQLLAGPFWEFARPFDTLTIAAGSALTFTHTALDQYKNPIPGLVLYAVSDLTAEPMTRVATTDANGTARFTANLDPYAATIFFSIKLDPSSGPWASTVVFATASRGAFRVIGPEYCPRLNGPGLVSGWVYGPTGHATVGVPITWIPQPGSGYVFIAEGVAVPATSVTTTSGSYGHVVVGWRPPDGAGTYTLTAVPSSGYDAVSPVLFTCHIS